MTDRLGRKAARQALMLGVLGVLMAIAMQKVGWLEVGFALLVVAIVALGWRMRVARPA
jgi:hypothetical protein